MMETQYSTGQASGITAIPIRTIQAYVKDFREFFSEEASQPSKGRRFTDPDIDKLQTIKRLRSERVPDDEIRQVLTGEVPLKFSHQYNEAELKKFAADLHEKTDRVMLALETAQALNQESKAAIYALRDENRQLREDNKTWKTRVENLHKWQLFVMENFPELNPYDHEGEPEPITQEKPKGLFGGLFGG